MTPKEAKALVKKSAAKTSGYLLVTISYRKFLLPLKQGMQLLECLDTAYMPEMPYSSPAKLHDGKIQDELQAVVYPPETVQAIQLSELLQVPFNEALTILRSPDHEPDQ